MKLTILNPTFPAYKREFFENLNTQLKEKNIELSVIYGSSFFKKTVRIITNPGYTAIPLKAVEYSFFSFRIAWWKGLFSKIRELKPDMVIINFNPGNLALWILQFYCYFLKIKVGIWGCGYIREEISGLKRNIRGIFSDYFLKKADTIICYGSKYKRDLISLGIAENKIFVAQNTINIERIFKIDFDKKNSISKETYVFLFVGALISEKNLDLAIKAIARLVREGYNIRFNIIGDGSILDDLRSLVAEEAMTENIFILGPKYDTELTRYFVEADIFILPGTGGLAINEAMAYELPLISTIGDGTISDLLIDGFNGFFLNDKPDLENIFLICKKAVLTEKQELIEMGRRSRKIVSEKATLQIMVSGFESAVNYMVNKKKNR
jgi:glycosyltransferase involved in cell wall biosynthesis